MTKGSSADLGSATRELTTALNRVGRHTALAMAISIAKPGEPPRATIERARAFLCYLDEPLGISAPPPTFEPPSAAAPKRAASRARKQPAKRPTKARTGSR